MVEQINLRKNMEFNKTHKFIQTKIRIAKKAILFLCHKIIMMDIDYTFFIAQGILLENVGITMTKFSLDCVYLQRNILRKPKPLFYDWLIQ